MYFIYIIMLIPMEILQEFTLLICAGKSDEFTLLFSFFYSDNSYTVLGLLNYYEYMLRRNF